MDSIVLKNSRNDAAIPRTGGVSVIIPARNAATTIMRTLRSLVSETSVISEILVIDDGSTDDTEKVAFRAGTLYELPVCVIPISGGSAGAARNAGIESATGEFLFFLDADDEVLPGGLTRLYQSLIDMPSAGLAIGGTIRRTQGRADKTKTPFGYMNDPLTNARNYLDNSLWPIAMGSALVVRSRMDGIRFPEDVGLDEDTCFWAALLSRERVVVEERPVLVYHLDERRMADRLIQHPRRTVLSLSREFNQLEKFGIARDTLRRRTAWVALRVTRQLLIAKNHAAAASMLRLPKAHENFRRGWKVFEYSVRISAGSWLKKPVVNRQESLPAHTSSRTMVLTYDPAWPPVSGGDLRNWDIARAAALLGPVKLISVRPGNDVDPPHITDLTVASLASADDRRTSPLVRNRTSIERRIPAVAVERILNLIGEFQPDRMIVCGIPLFGLLGPLRPHVRELILDMANVESHLAGLGHARAPLRKRIKRFLQNDVNRIRHKERKAASIVDRVWVCSEQDRDRVLAFSRPQSITVVPNGIPRSEQIPRELPEVAHRNYGWPMVLFVGHLGYGPNVEAAERLVHGVLPRMKHVFPQTKIVLAGRYPKQEVLSLAASPGVELIENPEDLRELYRQAHLCITPIQFGGGTRIKIIEAISWGLPVIATSCAVEGLNLSDGIDVSLAESDEELARRACELCTNEDRFHRQRTLAHAWIWQHYGPGAIQHAVRSGLGEA